MGREPDVGESLIQLIRGEGRQTTKGVLKVGEGVNVVVTSGTGQPVQSARKFFDWLERSSYRGPIYRRHEYELGDARQKIAHFQHDLKVLKEWLA